MGAGAEDAAGKARTGGAHQGEAGLVGNGMDSLRGRLKELPKIEKVDIVALSKMELTMQVSACARVCGCTDGWMDG